MLEMEYIRLGMERAIPLIIKAKINLISQLSPKQVKGGRLRDPQIVSAENPYLSSDHSESAGLRTP